MGEYSIAPLYDLFLFPFVWKLRRRILRYCINEKYQSILDVCCGTGNQLKLLKKNGFSVTGVDLSSEMLQVSQKGKYAPDCRFEDASRMSFPDSRYELAMTTFALHEKEPELSRAIIREMIRVVKPGGHIMLIDFHFTERSSFISKLIIRLIEWNAGGEHYENFRRFIEAGGLPPLWDKLPLEQKDVQYTGMNSLGIFVLRNRKNIDAAGF